MRYATARFLEHNREVAYRIYVTDSLRVIGENLAKSPYVGGQYLPKRFSELVYPKAAAAKAPADAEAIVADVVKRGGLKLV